MGRGSIDNVRLQQILVEIGMLQEEFARVFGVNQGTVSRWLSGASGVPGYVEAWLRVRYPEVMDG